MIYNGYFRQRTTDDLYTVRLTTSDGKSQTKEITLSGEPFTTQMDSGDETIYKSVKYQTATVGVVTSDYLFNIYSSRAHDTKVELLLDGYVVWVGYVRPNLYDIGFEMRREKLEVECADGLSTLQYMPYRTDVRKTRSFLYILNKLIKSCGCYKGFYVSDNINITSATATETLIDRLYISESNFFDEKDDNETDDDVAWKCNEVLEEICQYLGLTAIADKEYVYFLDYDAIRNGNNHYWYYAIDGGYGTRIETSFTKAVAAKDYSKSGATISLDNVYNKITVKADLNDYESVIPSLYENLTNITADTDPYVTEQSEHKKGEIVKSTLGDIDNKNMILLVDQSYLIYGNFLAAKYFNNSKYKLFKYVNGVDVTDSKTTLNFTDTKTLHGASVVKMYSKNVSVNIFPWATETRTMDELLADANITSIALSNYVMLLNPDDDYYISNDNMLNYPYLQTKVSDTSALFGGDNTYLIISGSYYYSPYSEWAYPYDGENIDINEGRYAMDIEQTYLVCKLQWGDKYWNGTEWTTTSSTFKLPYMKANASKEERRADATMFKDLDIRNTVGWRIGTSEKGYVIKCPTDTLMEGVPILTLYKPFDPIYWSTKSGDYEGQWYKHHVVFLKDFEIKAIISDPTYSDNNDTNTEYSMVIDDKFVTDLSDITMKINTWDAKKPCFSSVAYYDGSNYKWLNKVYNKTLADDVNGMQYINENNVYATSDGSLRNEWWLCYRLYKQYNQPSTIATMNLRNDGEIYGLYTIHDLDDKYFIVDSINRNYQANTAEYKFIEKK